MQQSHKKDIPASEEYDEIKSLVSSDKNMAASDIPGPYSYSSLLSDQEAPVGNEDIYGELMRKEDRVIETVNRVVNHAKLLESSSLSFFHQPLHLILVHLIETFKHILDDLIILLSSSSRGRDAKKSSLLKDAFEIFMKESRKIYVGLMLIGFAIIISLISLTF